MEGSNYASAAAPAAEDKEEQYFRWVSENFLRFIEYEDSRWQAIEKKAVIASTAAIAFGAFAFKEHRGVEGAACWAWICIVLAMVSTVVTLVYGYQSVVLREASAVNARQFLDEAFLKLPLRDRQKCLAEHLDSILSAARAEANRKGLQANKTQQWAILSALFYLAFLAAQVLGPS